ncbi:phospholipase [Actinokineospora fastidiosa]|uniref:phospholipase n=1 Tax=Actinokineospora fastidiosa TaxID=1816 RepID=UPI00167031E4|nr:phospholipase [Actinokineospora fastidiosa]
MGGATVEMGASGRRVSLRLRIGWLLLIVLAAGGYAVVASRGPRPPERVPPNRVTVAVDALLDPRPDTDPARLLPPDFAAVTGVRHGLMRAPDGTMRAVNLAGGCSAPWGDTATRWDYSVGCMAHDLGYDLLRYAAATGLPVDGERRRALDERLSLDMHAQCRINPRDSAGLCRMVASLFSVGLVVNSWHQNWGPPAAEPVGVWAVVLVMVVVLLAARLPAFRRAPRPLPRPPPSVDDPDRAGYVSLVGVLALGAVVLAETALAFAPLAAVPAAALWPLTWVLQLVPLFFFACGHTSLLAWRAGRGYGAYLAGRLCWLIRPVLALVTAWLAVPLSLELFAAPPEVATAFTRLVVQPLWLLGLSLLVVAVAPVLSLLHRAMGVGAAGLWLVVMLALEIAGPGTFADYGAGIALALLFAQLAHAYAAGTLPRAALGVAGPAAVGVLVLSTALGWVDPLLIAEPAGTASFVPSAAGVLLLGVAQVAVVALPRRPRPAPAVAQVVGIVRTAPMTVYLAYLCLALLVTGLVTALSARPAFPAEWLARPSTLLALGLVAVPGLVGFLLFEWRTAPEDGFADGLSRWDGVAAVLGVAYAALGVLGFAAGPGTAVLGLPLDPMAGIIHLLLGWYLLHAVRVGTSALPGPWLLAALACGPALLAKPSVAGLVLHGATVALAGVAAVACGARRSGQAADRGEPVVCQASGQPEGVRGRLYLHGSGRD